MPPLIAVITPTKNRVRLLAETMDSVAAQTMPDWEHLVVDDGSDDGTAEMVRDRATKDPRIRYIRREGDRSGANVCRNLGIRESRSEYVVFLDSDDVLQPACLGPRLALMQRNLDLDFATFQTGVFVKSPGDLGRLYDSRLGGDDLLRFLYFEIPWIITAPIWRKSALERLGIFDETFLSWQDVDLHLRAIASGFKYLRLGEVDHHVRWQFEATKVSIQQRRSPRHLSAGEDVLHKFEDVVRSGPGMTWTRQRALCSLHFFLAESWVVAGNLRAGLNVWNQIRKRRLGPMRLHFVGAGLLCGKALGGPIGHLCERAVHKWKGLMRLRYEPELVSP